jgi:hypothetical protein
VAPGAAVAGDVPVVAEDEEVPGRYVVLTAKHRWTRVGLRKGPAVDAHPACVEADLLTRQPDDSLDDVLVRFDRGVQDDEVTPADCVSRPE